MTKRILGVAVLVAAVVQVAVGLSAPVARASTTIVEPMGAFRDYAALIAESRVPSPDVTLTVEQVEGEGGACGIADAGGCFIPQEHLIVLTTALVHGHNVREAFYHELGHAWDAYVMQPWQRERFKTLIRQSGVPWDYEETNAALSLGMTAPREWFAEAYSLCARLRHIRNPWPYNLLRVGVMGAPALRATCRMIGRSSF